MGAKRPHRGSESRDRPDRLARSFASHRTLSGPSQPHLSFLKSQAGGAAPRRGGPQAPRGPGAQPRGLPETVWRSISGGRGGAGGQPDGLRSDRQTGRFSRPFSGLRLLSYIIYTISFGKSLIYKEEAKFPLV